MTDLEVEVRPFQVDVPEEEITELKRRIRATRWPEKETVAVEEEVGDLLFTLANIARRLDINPEEALQSTNRKFMRRFEAMERAVRQSGRNLDELALEEMDRLWDDAKAAERE